MSSWVYEEMKKKLTIALVSIFTLSLSLTPVSAAVKAGGPCSKAGTKSVFLSKTYTCIKSGKKLVWDKGVGKSSAVVPIAISIDNLDLKGVPQKAYDIVIKELNSRQSTTYTPTIIAGANVKQSRIDQELLGIQKAINLWSPYFLPDKFQVVYVNYGDENWLEQKSTELGLASMLPPGQTWREQFRKYENCPFAMAGSGNGVPTFVQCLGYTFNKSASQAQTGPHEYTHLYQQKYNAFNISWYMEGSASFFGWTLGFDPYEPTSHVRSYHLMNLWSQLPKAVQDDFKSKDLGRFQSRMREISGRNTQETANMSYWVGALATEALVALYGFDKFVEWTENMQNEKDVSKVLNQTYGFSADYFYEKLAPYVWAHIPS
jgi:hypothetical protein